MPSHAVEHNHTKLIVLNDHVKELLLFGEFQDDVLGIIWTRTMSIGHFEWFQNG